MPIGDQSGTIGAYLESQKGGKKRRNYKKGCSK
jgi:hypothetical protein